MSHAHWRIIGLSWWLLPPSQNKDCLREELRVGRSSLAPAPSLYPAFGWEQLGGKRGFHMNDVKTFTEDDSEDQEGAAAGGWPLATPHVRFPWKKIWAATFSIFFFKETLRISILQFLILPSFPDSHDKHVFWSSWEHGHIKMRKWKHTQRGDIPKVSTKWQKQD